MIRNLLTNAAKYSTVPEPIEIDIRIEPIDEASDIGALSDGGGRRPEVAVRVLDRGIGIDDDTSAHAFELFFRTKEATRVSAGVSVLMESRMSCSRDGAAGIRESLAL